MLESTAQTPSPLHRCETPVLLLHGFLATAFSRRETATMRTWVLGQFSAAAVLVTLCLLMMLVGCGNGDLTLPGDVVTTATPGGPTATPNLGAATLRRRRCPTAVSGDDCVVGPTAAAASADSGNVPLVPVCSRDRWIVIDDEGDASALYQQSCQGLGCKQTDGERRPGP